MFIAGTIMFVTKLIWPIVVRTTVEINPNFQSSSTGLDPLSKHCNFAGFVLCICSMLTIALIIFDTRLTWLIVVRLFNEHNTEALN